MNLGPILPTEDNITRFRVELVNASEAKLIAQEAKDPNMAPGIAARQVLAQRRDAREAKRFRITVIIGVIGIALAGLAAWYGRLAVLQQTQPAVQVPESRGSTQLGVPLSETPKTPHMPSQPATADSASQQSHR